MSVLTTVRTDPVSLVAKVQARGLADREAGMTTAEYAVGTVAAAGNGLCDRASHRPARVESPPAKPA